MQVVSTRRKFLIQSTTVVFGAAVAGTAWYTRAPEWARGPKLRDGHPILRMPIPAGMVVLCQQGNASPPGHTHSGGNCLFALDLSNCAEDVVPIVAAASGRVTLVYGEAKPGDSTAGLRFGNQIKVDHGQGYFTFYSHLEKITVREGDILRTGDPLGTMGSTGAAGNRHLHFSLHQGKPSDLGVGDTTPMRSLVTANVSRNFMFQSTPGPEFIAGEADLWTGRIYGSENAPNEPALDRAAQGDLLERLRAAHERLRIILDHRVRLDEVSSGWESHDMTWSKQILDPILAHTPKHALARYWFGTAVLMVQQQWDEAERIFDDLLGHGMSEPTWEMWLRSWIHNRLGVIAIARNAPDKARSHFVEALQLAAANPEQLFALDHLRRLRPHD